MDLMVYDGTPRSAADLATELRREPRTIRNALSALTEQGLLRETGERTETNGRIWMVTPAGRKGARDSARKTS
ncbi:hypothetical protein [Nocardia wallacei]|nr:hypothetical protein [Nocardia wallacei]